MKTNKISWHFWVKDEKWSFENPFSSISGSLTNAKNWATYLKFWNKHYETIYFRRIGGIKVYEL